jgi:tetratricopeptide (TPR) repeat protein
MLFLSLIFSCLSISRAHEFDRAAFSHTVPVRESSIAKPWWELYDDAMRAVDREDWRAALIALQQAVKQNPKSTSRARTYGMRFVEYFPYYYTGVAYYKLGDMSRALEYLDREGTRSGLKAGQFPLREIAFYKTAVNLALLQQQRLADEKREAAEEKPAALPAVTVPEPKPAPRLETSPTPPPAIEPPELTITRPRPNTIVRGEFVHVTGDVYDSHGIASITVEVNGHPVAIRIGEGGSGMQVDIKATTADQSRNLGLVVSFSTDVAVSLGETRILIRAANIRHQVVETTLSVNRTQPK